jgi:hypothetical protein
MPTRYMKDAALIKSVKFPAAGASASSDSLDLQSVDATFERIELEVLVPALSSLADTKTATVTIEESADNVTFAAIEALAPVVVTGVGVAGSAAKPRVVRLPSGTKRYIRITAVVAAAGGDNTAKSATMSLLF